MAPTLDLVREILGTHYVPLRHNYIHYINTLIVLQPQITSSVGLIRMCPKPALAPPLGSFFLRPLISSLLSSESATVLNLLDSLSQKQAL